MGVLKLDRRIGGLKMMVCIKQSGPVIDRRIGGLQDQILDVYGTTQIDRRAGGLQTRGIRAAISPPNRWLTSVVIIGRLINQSGC